MRRLILVAAVAALFLVALPVASAVAAPPQQVQFEGPAFFAGDMAGTGLFIASGPAVDSGAICENGVTETLLANTQQTPNGSHLKILKEFLCDDGSGSFFVELRVRIDNRTGTTFNWVVKGGTDVYENLKGNGNGFVAFPIFADEPPFDPIGVFDVYEGKIH